ncbi:MAG TPA: polysaccharide biosynthesis C-terminal domain-containing protein, partial [Terricaulis sp.]|nr:polysaccharide biosynthesis C-terminal domain-containing protein [Terricaulis sp.]
DTKAPMRFALISMLVNVALGAALFYALRAGGMPGFPGLAIATSVAAWINVLMMIATLAKRGAYAPSAAAMSRLVRIAMVSAGLGFVLWFGQQNRAALEAALGAKEIAVGLLILCGGIGYFVFLFISRAVTLGEVRAAFKREKGPLGGGGGLPPGMDP